MSKGAINFSMTTAVVVVLSVAVIISGTIFINSFRVELPSFERGMPQFFNVDVYPPQAQEGTTFKINVEFADKNLVYFATTDITKNGKVASVPLFDDGNHGDRKRGDGFYSGTFESKGFSEGIYNVDVIVNPSEKQIRYPNVSKFVIYKGQCIPLMYNGDPENKIDVEVIPSGYSDLEKFKKDAMKLIGLSPQSNGILTYEPFKNYSSNFNFYILNQSTDLGCKIGCQGVPSLVCCDNKKVGAAASQCPADKVIILKDSKDFCGSASGYAKICSGWNVGEVGTHEFGHIFGGLGDEYVYATSYPGYQAISATYPNCDVKTCPKWKSYWGGCFAGCGVSEVNRPVEKKSIMYTYVHEFNEVSIKHLVSVLADYASGSPQQVSAPPLEDTYAINLNYNNGKLSQQEVYVTQSMAPDRKSLRRVDYIGKIISFDGKTLNTFKFEIPKIEWPAMPREYERNDTSLLQSFVVDSDVNQTLLAPYFSNAKQLEIYNLNNQKMLTVDLGYLAKTCGDEICQPQESAVICAADCRPEIADNVCNYAQDNVCDPDCTKVDPDCGVGREGLYAIIGVAIVALLIIVFMLASKDKK